MTRRHDMEPLVEDWLHRTLDAIPDPIHRYPAIATEANQTPQQRGWLPQMPKWRFQSMFSATKFVVAGVIVALFGGFLLSGVLTMEPSEEMVPAVGASASASSSPVTMTRSDLLPGTDLEVEQVGPGVYRVLGDGEHDLREDVWQVAVTTEGEVFVQKHRTVGHGRDRWRVVHLGQPGASFRDQSGAGLDLHTVDDEMVRIALVDKRSTPSVERRAWWPIMTEIGARGYDGAEWIPSAGNLAFPCEPTFDGECWTLGASESGHDLDVLRVASDGTEQNVRGRDIFSAVYTGGGSPDVDDVEIAEDGNVWAIHGPWLATFDGERWRSIPSLPGIDDHQDLAAEMEIDRDGVVWVLGEVERSNYESGLRKGDFLLGRWDGERWMTFEPVDGPGVGRGLTIGPDRTIWVGPLTWFDGTTFHHIDRPASADSTKPELVSAAHAPDGSIWAVVADRAATGNQACPTFCEGETDGLYVITPEAWAATE